MNIFIKRTFLLVLTLILSGAVTASPALAGMGGGRDSDSGSGSGSGMNGSGGGEQRGTAARQERDTDAEGVGANREFREISSMPAISTGSTGSGDMSMEITPIRYSNGRLEVKYSSSTHSVSLDKYDLMELSTLEVDGKVYRPVKTDRMSGHHASGRIIFEVPEKPDGFRIVIRDIPRVNERLFDWN